VKGPTAVLASIHAGRPGPMLSRIAGFSTDSDWAVRSVHPPLLTIIVVFVRKKMPQRISKLLLPVLVSAAAVLLSGSTAQAAKRSPITVFPAPDTPVASDSTTFSFRGLKPKHLGPVKVTGSRSGRHRGKRLAHSDGMGVSFVPNRSFVPGEVVSVRTGKIIRRAKQGDFKIRIGRFYGKDRKNSKPKKPNRFPRLKSRPDLRPPNLKVLTSSPAASTGMVFFAPKQTGLTIADRLGRITWFRPTGFGGNGQEVQNFQAQNYRGERVLTYWKGKAMKGRSTQKGFFNVLDRNYRRIASFGMGNGYKPDAHELTISPRSTALAIAYRAVRWDTSRFGGSKHGSAFDNVVQEIDIKTGAVLFEWHSLGNVPLRSSVGRADGAGTWDYFHLNSVGADGDSFLISARKVNSLYRIDRRTAEIKWRLRGDRMKKAENDFRMGPGTSFGYQHDAKRLPNGDISLFDNGKAPNFRAVNRHSSVLILRLRKRDKVARAKLVKRVRKRPRPILATSQGGAEVLGNGNVFVGWGSVHRITEFSPEGSVVFDATFKAPTNSYRADKGAWDGRAPGRPVIASKKVGKKGADSGATVWASWNGAADIRYWQVMSGPGTKSLREVARKSWTGLETRIAVPKLGPKVKVIARGKDGAPLSSSTLVKVGIPSRGK
jgi:hypothetical protein